MCIQPQSVMCRQLHDPQSLPTNAVFTSPPKTHPPPWPPGPHCQSITLAETNCQASVATGDAFLVATGSSQIKVYDRDGKERGVSVAGDMYIRDLRNTKGHISPCTHAQWHPTDRYTGMTSSDDGSIRVWDTWNVLQKTVIKPQLAKPGRIAVTACAYNHDGGLIGGGMFDGTLQIWDVKGVLC